MKIDLHVHTEERSPCARSSEEEMIQAASGYGLDALVFTDHHRLVPLDRLEALNHKYAPFRIFGGIEISVNEGEDLLVLGVRDPALESRDWEYAALYDFVRERDGFLILAHPFRYYDPISIDLDRYLPDAIEVHSKHTAACDAQRISAVLERFDLLPLCNSDAHHAEHVGLYCNQLSREPQDERALIELLKAGDTVCQCMDQRIASFNEEIKERERLIRDMIARGQSRDDYRRVTGQWEGHYDRVAAGKSYQV